MDGAILDDPGNVETGWNFGPLGGLLDTAANVAKDRLKAQEAPKPQQTTQPLPVSHRAWFVPALIGVGVLIVALFAFRR